MVGTLKHPEVVVRGMRKIRGWDYLLRSVLVGPPHPSLSVMTQGIPIQGVRIEMICMDVVINGSHLSMGIPYTLCIISLKLLAHVRYVVFISFMFWFFLYFMVLNRENFFHTNKLTCGYR